MVGIFAAAATPPRCADKRAKAARRKKPRGTTGKKKLTGGIEKGVVELDFGAAMIINCSRLGTGVILLLRVLLLPRVGDRRAEPAHLLVVLYAPPPGAAVAPRPRALVVPRGIGRQLLFLRDRVLAAEGGQAAGKAKRNNKSVILIWLDGGPSHMETYDPKPEAPKEYRGPWLDMPTNVPGKIGRAHV